MSEAEELTAREAILKLAPLIAKTTGYTLDKELINMLTTWMTAGLELYEMARKNQFGVPTSRKQLLIMLVDRLNATAAFSFDAMHAETAKCVTSLVGTGITGSSAIGTTVGAFATGGAAIPLAAIEVTSLIVDILSLIKDCEKPATELRDKVFEKYDSWVDDAARTWAVFLNQAIYGQLPDGTVLAPF